MNNERECPLCKGAGFLDHSKPVVPVKPAVSNEVRLSTAATIMAAMLVDSLTTVSQLVDESIVVTDLLIEKIYGGKND